MRKPCVHGASLVATGRRRGFRAVSPPLGAVGAVRHGAARCGTVRHGARFAGPCGGSRSVRACRLVRGDQPGGRSRSPHRAEGTRVEQPQRASEPGPGASRASRAPRSGAARCEVRRPVRRQPLRARLQARTERSTRRPLAKSAPCGGDARRVAATGLRAGPRSGTRVAGTVGDAEQSRTVRGSSAGAAAAAACAPAGSHRAMNLARKREARTVPTGAGTSAGAAPRRRTGGPVPAGTGPPVRRVVAPTAP